MYVAVSFKSMALFWGIFTAVSQEPFSTTTTPLANLPSVSGNDTARKLSPVSLVSLTPVVNSENNIRLLTTWSELEEKKLSICNSTTQRCPNKIFKTFLVEDFSICRRCLYDTGFAHWAANIFKNFWKNWTALMGFGEIDSWKNHKCYYLRYMLMVMSLFSLSTCEMPRMYPFTDTATIPYFLQSLY